jgi:hypothetical protein
MTEQPVDLTTEDVRRIAQEIVTVAIDDVPTIDEVQRIVDDAIERQSKLYEEREERRSREYYDMMNSVDRHLRAVEGTMQQVAQTVAEFKGMITTLPDMRSDVDRLQTEVSAQSARLAVVNAAHTDLKEDIFGDDAGKPPSLYRLLEQRGQRSDEQHDALMRVLQEDIKPRLERAEKYIESRRALEQQVVKVAQIVWKYIAASRLRFTVFALFTSLVAAHFVEPAALENVGKLIRALFGG